MSRPGCFDVVSVFDQSEARRAQCLWQHGTAVVVYEGAGKPLESFPTLRDMLTRFRIVTTPLAG